jgi:hypothetical protein
VIVAGILVAFLLGVIVGMVVQWTADLPREYRR